MGDLHGIIKRVGVLDEGLAPVEAAQYEELVKPRDMTDFPQKRIDDGEPRPHKLVDVEAVDQRAGAPMRIVEGGDEIGNGDGPGGFNTHDKRVV